MTITTITNKFTGYNAKIATQGMPAVATIKRHLAKSKGKNCQSITIIEVDGVRHDLINLGSGLELRQY